MSPPESSSNFQNTRAHNLSFAKENSNYNRDWFMALREQVAGGEKMAFVSADVPTEIFKAMGIPVVVNQWWGAVVAAKQKSGPYLQFLNDQGFRKSLCGYCSLAYASTFETDPAQAPWGGLPAPSLLVVHNDCGAQQKIFELWAKRFDIPLFVLERKIATKAPPADWLDHLRDGWDDIFGTEVIDFLADQFKDLIKFLKSHTNRSFDADKLSDVMSLVNEQEEYYAKTRDLIASSRPAPLNIADQMPATMIPQWHRGTAWGRDRAALFHQETERKIANHEAAAPNERIRLMWLGTGLWYNLGFYEYFQDRYGAVFVWSIYTAIAADAYPTYGDDPIRTLAARMTKIQLLLNTPPYNLQWFLHEAKRAGIDGVVSLGGGTDDDCRETFGQHALLRQAFERAGIPVLRLGVDNADARAWDDEAIRGRVGDFIDTEILPRRAGKDAS